MATTTTTATTTGTTALTTSVKEKFSGDNLPLGIVSSLAFLISVGMMIVGPWLGAIALQSPDSTTRALAGTVIAFSVFGFILTLGVLVIIYTMGCRSRPYAAIAATPAATV